MSGFQTLLSISTCTATASRPRATRVQRQAVQPARAEIQRLFEICVGGCHNGRAVQVDPMKPTLKPPGTKRLILRCDIPLSTSALKFNLRRYTMDAIDENIGCDDVTGLPCAPNWLLAGAYTHPLLSST